MERRGFITLLGGVAAGWPLAAHAQQSGPMRRIGFLIGGAESDPQIVEALAAFKATLEGLGWIEGRNIRIDYRFAAADVDRMRVFAKELVALQPDVLMGHTTQVVARLSAKPKPSPSCSSSFPIRSEAGSSKACRVPAATSRGSSTSKLR
jgi:putative ABC transport system substrate-binding protein